MNKYHRWFDAAIESGSQDLPPGRLLDEYTLALASLSLSTKSTECPRRLRDILLPAYAILHSGANANANADCASSNKRLAPAQTQTPLTYPSHKYDTLRQTLVQAELILLRALGFAIYVRTPYEFLPRLVGKVVNTKVYGSGGGGWGGGGGGGVGGDGGEGNGNSSGSGGSNCGVEDWESYTPAEAEECGVVGTMQTGLGRRSRVWVERAVREYALVNWYTMRTVAVACVWLAMREAGWSLPDTFKQERGQGQGQTGGKEPGGDRDGDGNTEGRIDKRVVSEWMGQLSSGKVDPDDFWEVIAVLESKWAGAQAGEPYRRTVE